MKKGFVLIEIMIGTVVAAVLSVGLLNTIMQVTQLQQTINGITSTYGRMAIFQQQLERDISGAFVPTQYDLLQTKTGQKSESKKPLEKIFNGQSKGNGGRFEYLTFITSNPLEIFFGIKDITLKPRVARVVYRLLPDPRHKNSYVLMRQEGTTNLSFDNYKENAQGDFRAFEMIDGIQDLSVRFISIEEKIDKDKKKRTYTYKKAPDWKAIDDAKEKSAGKLGSRPPQRPRPRLPQQVEFTLSLWDSGYEKYKEFTLTIPVAIKYGEFDMPDQKKKDGEQDLDQDKQEDKKQKEKPKEKAEQKKEKEPEENDKQPAGKK